MDDQMLAMIKLVETEGRMSLRELLGVMQSDLGMSLEDATTMRRNATRDGYITCSRVGRSYSVARGLRDVDDVPVPANEIAFDVCGFIIPTWVPREVWKKINSWQKKRGYRTVIVPADHDVWVRESGHPELKPQRLKEIEL